MVLAAALGLASGASLAWMLSLLNAAINAASERDALSGAWFVVACVAVLVSTAGAQLVLIRIAQSIVLGLQLRLLRAIVAAPLRALEEIGAPRLLSALTADVDAVSRAAPWVAGVLTNSSIITACLVYLSSRSAGLVVVLLVALVAGGSTYLYFARQGMRSIRAAAEARDALFRHFRAATEGVKELKLHRSWRTRFLDDLLRADALRFRAARIRGTSIFAATGAWGITFFFLTAGAVVFVAPVMITVDPQTLVEFSVGVVVMITPVRALMNGIPELARSSVALARVDELGLALDATREAEPDLVDQSEAGRMEQIELRDIAFAFESEGEERGFSVGPLDLTVRAGELVFIVGANGSGKSTLAKLITGLYTPTAGRIVVDGRAIGTAERERYRALFSAVFADYYLFDELLGGALGERQGDANRYLERFGLDHKVRLSGRRLSTTALSSGQRKRLALLACVLEDRPILVLDEWAADQDPRFKEIFYRELLSELRARGKTIIAITHDERYFDVADRVIRLDDGQLVTLRGTPG